MLGGDALNPHASRPCGLATSFQSAAHGRVDEREGSVPSMRLCYSGHAQEITCV